MARYADGCMWICDSFEEQGDSRMGRRIERQAKCWSSIKKGTSSNDRIWMKQVFPPQRVRIDYWDRARQVVVFGS